MFERKRRAPADPGLAQIDAWEAWLLEANRQRMRDDGLDAETVAREWPAVAALVAAAADAMRQQYLANRSRRQP